MDLLKASFKLTAIEIANKTLNTCHKTTPVSQAAEIIRHCKTSSILVEDSRGKIVGIWTESDSKALVMQSNCNLNSPIEELMSSPVATINHAALFQDVIVELHRKNVRHLLVVGDDGSAVGIVSQSDLVSRQGVEAYLKLRKVHDNYDATIPFVCGSESISVVAESMAKLRSSSAIIVDKASETCGMLTERDLLSCIANQSTQLTAWEYAVKPLIKVHENECLARAYAILKQNKIRHLVVYNDDKTHAGVLSLHHVLTDIENSYVSQLENILLERDSALAESQRNLTLAERIIDASLDSIMVTDVNAKIISINPAFTNLTGYEKHEVIGKPASLLSSGRHDDKFYLKMWSAIEEKGTWQGEIINKKKNGEEYSEWLTIIKIANHQHDSPCFAAIFSDITERKQNERKIHALAFYDELTSLPNRRLFRDRAEVALSTAHRNGQYAAVLFLDLDGFKQINDNLGHSVGDNLLKITANRLATSVKEGDTVSRFGGDEFVVLLTEINDPCDVSNIIDRLSSILKKPYFLNNKEYQVTSSIGVALYPCDGETTEVLLKHADVAMYQAKDSGRNNYCMYSKEMNSVSMERLEMQNLLRNALENDEFELHYQLKIEQSTQTIVGLEALLRWSSAKLGQVSPSDFIPVAESLGLIVDIDRWVLQQACLQRAQWLEKGVNCGKISVNISARHFNHDLIGSIDYALAVSSLPAELLDIEVTESCLIDNVKSAKRTLETICKRGVSISLDDFGTGFSALSYLTELPLQTLKIDASFVNQLPGNIQQSQIVKTIIAMAKGLSLTVVAEGVENTNQAMFLAQEGCDIIQGYLFSRPMSALQIENDISHWQTVNTESNVVLYPLEQSANHV